MVKVTLATSALLVAAAAVMAAVDATKMNFVNKCMKTVQLYHSQGFKPLEKLADIASGKTHTHDVSGPAHMFRDGFDTDATLAEFSIPGDGKAWYDISIIPPMPGHCNSFENCKQVTGKKGFNVPMDIVPRQNTNGRNCRKLVCPSNSKTACADAYHFPADTKTHDCPASTEFDVVFCPGGGDSAADQTPSAPTTKAPAAPTKAPAAPATTNNNSNKTPATAAPSQNSNIGFNTTNLNGGDQGKVVPANDDVASDAEALSMAALGGVRAKYSYKGKQAGNVPGSYDRVTKLAGCVRQRVSLNSPVGPLSEEVSMVFRGPMEIYNIAVYDGSSGTFQRVSSYDRSGGQPENLVFMNNKNIDYSGQNRHGPQGFAGADGVATASSPTKLGGLLKEATNPSAIGAGPGIQTGAEVNIMTGKKCNGGCVGYHGDNDYHGWGGGRKVFVTKVKMPNGAKPNQPAIWMLNAQVLHSNQYGCNCRGMGPVGGCGELDIAEVIETNAARNKVTTHYYFYDGSVVAPGGDNFAARPFDRAVSYVTIIDDRNGGLVKIIELDNFDYSQKQLSAALYQQLVNA